MVIRILTGKDVVGAVQYNERKVGEGQAERIHIANYPNQQLAEKHSSFRLQLLEQQARLNPAISKPSVHVAIAFHPTEAVDDSKLRQIGTEVLTKAGFGQQPYLMYRHDDTEHPHIHIVTVSVDPNGDKISDRFMKNRLNQIRREVELRYGLVKAEGLGKQGRPNHLRESVDGLGQLGRVGDIIKLALETNSFGSIDSFRQYLSLHGVLMNTTAGRSKSGITFQGIKGEQPTTRPIRASSLECNPSRQQLEQRFNEQRERHSLGRNEIATMIYQRLSRYESLNEADFKSTLQKDGIQVVSRGGAYLYIDSRIGLVVQEIELGTALCRQSLLNRFAEQTTHKLMQEAIPGDEHKLVSVPPVLKLKLSLTPPKDVKPQTSQRFEHVETNATHSVRKVDNPIQRPEKVGSSKPTSDRIIGDEQMPYLPIKSGKEKKIKRKNRLKL